MPNVKYIIFILVIVGNGAINLNEKILVYSTTTKQLRLHDTLPFMGNRYNYGKLVQLMQLDDLKASSSEHFRIWFEYSFSNIGTVVTITNNEDGWIARRYIFNVITKPEAIDTIAALDFAREIKRPVSGNLVFRKKIDSLNIFELKDYSDYFKAHACMGVSDAYFVEMFKESLYRNIPYVCPFDEFDDVELHKLENLKKLIRDEFGFANDFESVNKIYHKKE